MSTIKIQAGNQFCIGHYKKSSDVKRQKEIDETFILNALGKSKEFDVRDCFDDITSITFSITNIEKNEYGDYIYTVESNIPTKADYFPHILAICEDYKNVASPISYTRL